METAYLLFTLLCPLSMVALVGWWFWSMRSSAAGKSGATEPVRTAAEQGELGRMRAQLDQLQAGERDSQQQRA
jgi:hypothetical protein